MLYAYLFDATLPEDDPQWIETSRRYTVLNINHCAICWLFCHILHF
jgi:hypothetical protein